MCLSFSGALAWQKGRAVSPCLQLRDRAAGVTCLSSTGLPRTLSEPSVPLQTYYGTDGWSIHTGSCGFGYQWPDVGTGFDVAAIADAAPEFGGSCGRCYEVKCDPQSAVPDGAYERLSDVKWGVMGIQYQEVPCTKAADNPAPPIANPTPRERADLFSSALPRPSV
ncbi:hypothetical protein F751_1190 [Auxenochlorella protothecoides]|uniref:Expansin-like EG45 domain-containing protein n=1 Tax=Auxenochlorella protothecoides TaxID=3075 RepID=A0A087SNV9_AUXPR|nr:hypothetical protein F751_1190 [Auxenochlorella protothecoides]KFM27413.1 hypothetical protein F751_1190 [Auxenochlorella protothecoides]